MDKDVLFKRRNRLEEYDFKYMRKLLAEYGISAPESDEELGNNWYSYVRKLERLTDE